MSVAPLTEADLAELRKLDTPTVCNALELVVPERRGFGYTTEPLFCARPELPPIVGYVRTATIRAMHPSEEPQASRDRRMLYYRTVSESPGPTVSVVQDLDPQPGYGAFWGEVNTNLHKGLGCIGVVTNGSIRDLDLCAEGFQLLAGKVAPSHAFVHVVDVGVPVTVAGMRVRGGDLIHADRHGAVVVPLEAARRVPAAAATMARREAVLIEASRRPGFGMKQLAEAFRQYDEIP